MEKTSDVDLKIGVRANTNTGVVPSPPGDRTQQHGPATGQQGQPSQAPEAHVVQTTKTNAQLADTGQPLLLIGGVAVLLVVAAVACWCLLKRRRHGTLLRRGIMSSLGLLMVGLSVWGLSASAAPVMSLQSGLQAAQLTLVPNGTASQSVDAPLQLAAYSSTGYALEATIVSGDVPAGLELAVSGGDLAQPTAVASGGTRLITRKQPSGQGDVPVAIRATASPTTAEGEYTIKLRFTLKLLPSSQGAHQFATVAQLMAAPLKAGDYAKITDFTEANDQVSMFYHIVDALPEDQFLRRVAVPLANGTFGLPQTLNTKLPEANDPQRVRELLEVAQTYADAGTKLRWDPTRPAPLHTSQVIHQRYQSPYALTCSSFLGMALLAWKFQDTTYVADTNTASYSWGTTFKRPAGTQPPFQAWKMLAWLYWGGRAAVHTPGAEYQPGDIFFFSQQDPEGVGTGGNYFMNVYHTGIYLGNNKIIHSYSNQTPHGVMVETLSPGLKKNLTFVARPNLVSS